MKIFVRAVLRAAVAYCGLPDFLDRIRSNRWLGLLLSKLVRGRSYSCLESSLAEIGAESHTHRPALLAIGVKKENGRFSAHAWVEGGGEAFDEREGFKKIGTL